MQEIAAYAQTIANEFSLTYQHVRNTLSLLAEGATIPFVARYRKEMTGSMNEEIIEAIQKRFQQMMLLDKRRLAVLESIREQEKLSPQLQAAIEAVKSMQELEDLYLPYKPKRRTRATIAKEKGLEPLAKLLFEQKESSPLQKATIYVKKEKGVDNVDEALAGARDIVAEWISESRENREPLRRFYNRTAEIASTVIPDKAAEAQTYRQYFDWKEPLSKAPSHRLLALFRAENEGMLRLKFAVIQEQAVAALERINIRSHGEVAIQMKLAIADAWKRLLAPSLENELRAAYKEKADETAIRVFAENLRQLLMAPPLGKKRIMAIDPGFRTGCKLVMLDEYGNLLHNETIYPHPPVHEVKQAVQKLKSLANAYRIEVIAIGNGTAGRETEDLVRNIRFDREMVSVMVNESGASVYSASKVARDEFPEYDITVRGAVSIGRRLMDPLAELVKIDPKSIGVGQYQHDVDQKALNESLARTVESCVNAVGVELNTASEQLLAYVSGVGPQLASNIVAHRKEIQGFKSREELLKVKRLGEKVFEQCAGFLRIHGAENPLDASAVHPESYDVVEKIARDVGCSVKELVGQKNLGKKLDVKKYTDNQRGIETLTDILAELEKPDRDPREQFEMFEFAKDIRSINDLRKGMVLNGLVTNITAFGAFVDVGVHQDGLVHVSQMADRFVRDPNEVVKLNQQVKVEVLDVDLERNRIRFTMKLNKASTEKV
jgi:protein Tex